MHVARKGNCTRGMAVVSDQASQSIAILVLDGVPRGGERATDTPT